MSVNARSTVFRWIELNRTGIVPSSLPSSLGSWMFGCIDDQQLPALSVRRRARSLGLAVTTLLAACDSSTGPQPDVLLPLRVGNSWTYETSIIVESGPYTPPPPGSFTMRVARFVRVGDEEWAEIEGASGIVFGVGGVAGLPRVLNRSDGLWMQQ